MSEATLPTPDLGRLRIARKGKKRSGGGTLKILIAVLLVGGATWAFRDRLIGLVPRGAATQEQPRTGVVREVSALDVADSGTSANGYVVARRKAALSTVLSGRLVELAVEEGTEVAEGQVVARIQYDDYEAEVREAERAFDVASSEIAMAKAQVAVAQAQIDEAETAVTVAQKVADEVRTEAENMQREMQRQRASREAAGDLSESEWDKMESQASMARQRVLTSAARVEAARIMVASAKADGERWRADLLRSEAAAKRAQSAVDAAKVTLEKTFVRAPFAGTIVRKEAEEGEVVSSISAGNSRGSVATLVDMATLEVQVELTEKSLGGITQDRGATIVLDALPERRWRGHVRQVWPTADRQKGTIELRIVFDERPPELRPEMGVRVTFHDQAHESRPAAGSPPVRLVAAAAVRDAGAKPYVFEVVGEIVRRREIELGDKRGGDYVVRAGLARGARVILDPPAGVKDGDAWIVDEE
jgi:HlyD family secretion protein